MRVVLVSAEYPPMEGGVGDYTRRLALALRQQSVDAAVLASAGAIGRDEDRLEVYPLVRRWGWGSLVTIARFLRQRRFDVVHLQYQTGAYRMHPAVHFLPGLLRRLPHTPRLVVTMHDLRLPYLFPKAGRIRHAVVAHMLCTVDLVVVTNGADLARLSPPPSPAPAPGGARTPAGRPAPSDADLLRPLSPGALRRAPCLIPLGSSLAVSLPGYDREAWRARLGLPAAEPLLGYFGLLHPSKGAELLLEALAELRRAGRRVRLLVVGGGTGATDPGNVAFQEALQAQIAHLGLQEAVLWTGPCPAEQAAAHLRTCDLVVLPYRDGASFRRSSLVAALTLGCAVVTTVPLEPAEVRLGPGQPTLRHGENAFLVPGGDTTALAAALNELLLDSDRRQRLEEGAGRLGKLFSWDVVAGRTREAYIEIGG